MRAVKSAFLDFVRLVDGDIDEVARRLAKFCFVKVHVFDKQGMQPEHLSEDDVEALGLKG